MYHYVTWYRLYSRILIVRNLGVILIGNNTFISHTTVPIVQMHCNIAKGCVSKPCFLMKCRWVVILLYCSNIFDNCAFTSKFNCQEKTHSPTIEFKIKSKNSNEMFLWVFVTIFFNRKFLTRGRVKEKQELLFRIC